MNHPQDPLIAKLIARLNAPDPTARRNAVAALRFHGQRAIGALPYLTGLAEDADPRVRSEAARALRVLSSAAA